MFVIKILESPLSTYHKGAKEYRFLNSGFINGFDELNNLFFSALAKNIKERHPKYAEKFQYIPYLNSSLFERNELETETFEISALNDDEMEVFSIKFHDEKPSTFFIIDLSKEKW